MFGHTVVKLTILDNEFSVQTKKELDALVAPNVMKKQHNANDIAARRDKLKMWIAKNRVPVSVDGDKLVVADVLEITPPYDTDSCFTGNPIILQRIQKLIERMPTDDVT